MKLRRNKKVERCEHGVLYDPSPFPSAISQIGYEVHSEHGIFDVMLWRAEHNYIEQEGICIWANDKGDFISSNEPPTYQLSIAWPDEAELRTLLSNIIKEIAEYEEEEEEEDDNDDEQPEFVFNERGQE